MRRHSYGFLAIVVGAWEALAFAGVLPTVTCMVRSRWWLRLIALGVLGGTAKHVVDD